MPRQPSQGDHAFDDLIKALEEKRLAEIIDKGYIHAWIWDKSVAYGEHPKKAPDSTEETALFIISNHHDSSARIDPFALLTSTPNPAVFAMVSPGALWSRIKIEFHRFICSKDKRYAKIKKELVKQGNNSQTVIVSGMSVAIAARLGVEAGFLVPLIGISLITLIKIGKEAYFPEAQTALGPNITAPQQRPSRSRTSSRKPRGKPPE